MDALKHLLTKAVKRANISTQVNAARVVSLAQDVLRDLLGERSADARAISYVNGILTIETRHASASRFLHESEHQIKEILKRHIPELPIKTVRYRIVGRFRGSEIDRE